MSKKIKGELTSGQRAQLKGLAHSIRPVVQVGDSGISEAVLSEVKIALDAHQLIKVQLPGQTDARLKSELEASLIKECPVGTHLVARVGRNVILFQEQPPEKSKIILK